MGLFIWLSNFRENILTIKKNFFEEILSIERFLIQFLEKMQNKDLKVRQSILEPNQFQREKWKEL